MFYKYFFLLALVTSPLCAAMQPTEQPQNCPCSIKEMSDEQRRMTGVDKLSDDEQEALDAWLCEQWNACQNMKQGGLDDQSQIVTIAEVQENGRKLVLSDGMLYTIVGSGIKKTAGWVQGDRVRVITTKRPAVVKLKNLTQDQTVRARRKTAE